VFQINLQSFLKEHRARFRLVVLVENFHLDNGRPVRYGPDTPHGMDVSDHCGASAFVQFTFTTVLLLHWLDLFRRGSSESLHV
jgi:hypothetical protein